MMVLELIEEMIEPNINDWLFGNFFIASSHLIMQWLFLPSTTRLYLVHYVKHKKWADQVNIFFTSRVRKIWKRVYLQWWSYDDLHVKIADQKIYLIELFYLGRFMFGGSCPGSQLRMEWHGRSAFLDSINVEGGSASFKGTYEWNWMPKLNDWYLHFVGKAHLRKKESWTLWNTFLLCHATSGWSSL